jgi:4-hydroxybenzoate polyprenyltransferase
VRLLTTLINWILYTSIFAACCATGLCMATEMLLLGHSPAILSPLHLLVFCSTLLVYNTHYLVKKSTAEISDRFAWSQHYRLWHYLLWGAGLSGCSASVFFLPARIWEACVWLAVLSFAYSLPLLPFKNKRRIKDYGWVKILVLTAVWTIVTSVLPMLYWDKPLAAYPFEILIRFVFMFTLCVAFDIRDMQTDLDSGIITLPNIIGLKNSYRLMDVTIALFVLLSVVQYLRYPSPQRLSGEIITAVVTRIVILYAKRHPSDKVYLGFVDGMMLLYALLVLWL